MEHATYTTAILLAAGRGSRFGGEKLLAELDGIPIVRRAAERVLLARPAELIVVVPEDDATVRPALDGLPVRFAAAPRGGAMASSLHAGLAALRADSRRVLVALGDQPLLDPSVVARVLAAEGAPIVVPSYRGVRGHPVRFDASLLPELLAIDGDRGARDVIGRDPSRVLAIDVDLAPPADVDTPGDLRALREADAAGR